MSPEALNMWLSSHALVCVSTVFHQFENIMEIVFPKCDGHSGYGQMGRP